MCVFSGGGAWLKVACFFIYAIMYILIQTYTSHNSSINKIK